jgi:hypothetical protein
MAKRKIIVSEKLYEILNKNLDLSYDDEMEGGSKVITNPKGGAEMATSDARARHASQPFPTYFYGNAWSSGRLREQEELDGQNIPDNLKNPDDISVFTEYKESGLQVDVIKFVKALKMIQKDDPTKAGVLAKIAIKYILDNLGIKNNKDAEQSTSK